MHRFLLIILMTLTAWTRGGAEALRIYCESAPPNQFLLPDGSLTGMAVEVVREIQKLVGNSDPIQLVPWARGYDALQKQPNVVLFSVARTPEREPLFHWIGPLHELRFNFYVKADSHIVINSMEDAKQVGRIGVYNNDVRDEILTKAGFRNLDRSTSNVFNFKKLMTGRIDAYTTDAAALDAEAREAGYRAEDVKAAFTFMRVQIYVAISRGTPESTVKAWSEAFAILQKKGVFAKVYKTYFPGLTPPTKAIPAS